MYIYSKCNTILLATGRQFSQGTSVSSTYQTDRNNITKILLKVALNTIKPNQNQSYFNDHIYEASCIIYMPPTFNNISEKVTKDCRE